MKHLEALISIYQANGDRPLPSMVMRAIKLDAKSYLDDLQIHHDAYSFVAVDSDGQVYLFSEEPEPDDEVFDTWLPRSTGLDTHYAGIIPGWMFDFIRPQIYWKDLITEIN